MAPQGQQEALASIILEQVTGLVGDGAGLAPTTPLMSAGLTSSLAVQLVSALEAALGSEIPGTLVFDYPSAVEIAEFLLDNGLAGEVLPAEPAADVAEQALSMVPAAGGSRALAPRDPARAVVCVVSGSAHSVPGGKLGWQGAAKNDRITRVALERWDTEIAPADNPAGALLR